MSGEKVATRYKVHTPNVRSKFEEWIRDRGGVAVWRSLDLSNLSRGDMYQPLRDNAGHTYPKPHWAYAHVETVTDISKFQFVREWIELERCKIALNKKPKGYDSPFGFFPTAIVLTAGSTRRVESKCSHWKKQYPNDVITYRFEELEAVFERGIFEE